MNKEIEFDKRFDIVLNEFKRKFNNKCISLEIVKYESVEDIYSFSLEIFYKIEKEIEKEQNISIKEYLYDEDMDSEYDDLRDSIIIYIKNAIKN